jgi:death-on-curing family protein
LQRPTSVFIEAIHDDLITTLWPDTDPVSSGEYRDQGLIDSAVNRPFQTACGEEIHPTLADKGVALFHSLISNHPFANGNKRTAVLAVQMFFWANDHNLFLNRTDAYRLAEETAQYKERTKSQEESLSEAKQIIGTSILPLDVLRQHMNETGDETVKAAYEMVVSLRDILLKEGIGWFYSAE